MGGMAAFIPIKNNPSANAAAMAKVTYCIAVFDYSQHELISSFCLDSCKDMF